MTAVTQIRPDAAALYSVEAEQQVLGALLLNSDQAAKVDTAGGAGLFFDPVHARIFDVISSKARGGMKADVVTVGITMQAEQGLNDLGGSRYLVRLAGASISPHMLGDYLKTLAELARKRHLHGAISEAQNALVKGDDDAQTIAAKLEGALIASEATAGDRGPVSMMKAVAQAMQVATSAYHGEDNGAVKSGIPALDSIVPGFFPGEMTLLGGRPSMGKTAVALTLALNAAREGHGVAIASLEMTPESLAMRALSEATSEAGNAVPYTSMRKGEMTEAQMRTVVTEAQYLAKLPITFLPRHYSDVGSLVSGTRQIARAGNLRLLIVDYAQLLRAEGKSRYEQITNISIALKALAVSLDLPVIALSQLSRDLERRDDKRPMMSDLRESGQLEQDADNVLFCYREEYYLERKRPDGDDMEELDLWQAAMDRHRGALEIIVAKQRMGDIGTAHCRCALAMNRVWSE
ncbi:DnaB-like helicase C-terminal domain-containing protein [Paracoccus sp. DMF]|uniref:DnaB-like helicase C-terminal domain-containing protein n=1 Tax=Paracoccus sp. DMF TaxID=400837 RepID=UPI0021E435F9|nr:DnaB-like helicase C-terminal domain-containing protein [Paracoccus sp. DMF]MCV2449561.1 AAA family ATPase [Paracoccus sp. DMF]